LAVSTSQVVYAEAGRKSRRKKNERELSITFTELPELHNERINMYGLPEDFDGSFFVGRSVRTIAFSGCMTELIFDGDVAIGLLATYECHFAGDDKYVELRRIDAPVTSSRLMQLVGRKVVSVDAEKKGTLTLHFEGGHIFRCFDDACGYESYSIGHGSEEIIV
jgi:hypothetical protein